MLKIILSTLLWISIQSVALAQDTYEAFNRDVENYNASIDQTVIKPTTKGYVAVVPDPARKAVSNVVSNLLEPVTILNDILQGKLSQGVQDSARFIFNSTFGLLGLIDIATPMGLSAHDEDFGQTFAVWGWKDSDYLNLPLLGPSTIRDTLGKPMNIFLTSYGIPFTVLRVLTVREKLLPYEPMLESASDRYIFVRDGYLQKRDYEINDGVSQNNTKLNQFDFSD